MCHRSERVLFSNLFVAPEYRCKSRHYRLRDRVLEVNPSTPGGGVLANKETHIDPFVRLRRLKAVV